MKQDESATPSSGPAAPPPALNHGGGMLLQWAFSTGPLGVMRVLAISGSLRAASLNTALLRAVARIAPPGVEVVLYRGIGDLPLFNPDIEATDPAAVANLRAQIMAADALLIASPEYAHGVTGAIKNALDWMVGNESFIRKPVALFNASPRATLAQAALRETISTMSARIIDEACIAVPILGSGLNEDGIVQHPEIKGALLAALRALGAAVLVVASEQGGAIESQAKLQVTPNPPVERTATGRAVPAAHVER